MDTPTPDPSRSWLELTNRAHDQRPPAIDVRAAVRVALAREPVPETNPSVIDALFDLLALPWTRVVMASGLTAACVLAVLGWQAYDRDLSDPLLLTFSPSQTRSTFTSTP